MQLTVNKIADDCIRTADLCIQNRLLYQLRPTTTQLSAVAYLWLGGKILARLSSCPGSRPSSWV